MHQDELRPGPPRGRTRVLPAAPERFGPYRLDAVLARSPAATVYRATDTLHGGRAVALKVFAPALSAEPGFRSRFRHDVALLGAIRQPHVVPIHRYGVLDGVVYLDMQLIDGPSLAAVRRRGLAPDRAAAVAGQLAEALAALETGGLGARTVDAAEVLLAGEPGREFVHLVGLGLGRPGRGLRPDPGALVRTARAPRRRAPVLVAAALLATVGTAAGLVLTGVLPPDPAATGPPRRPGRRLRR